MKKIMISLASLAAAISLFVFPSSSSAATYYSAGPSTPSLLVGVYGKNVWSQKAYWDLRNIDSIPDTAVIESINIRYGLDSNAGMNFSNTHVALFNEKGEGKYTYTGNPIPSYGSLMDSGLANPYFRGQKVKQLWSVQYYTSNSLRGYIKPNLNIFWKDPSLGHSGSVAIQ
ncbi:MULTISPECIES: hypothetical protein [Bacillus]|uniref:hypothetical protein n=1 Tax=Bacillus TaxID=1386 RepID=UPI00047AE088|nr:MULTISPECIES: hypothetical protein [Bacillus]QHZ48108.1 hypothetical protein M654_018300 [Bacillus sp. NSP9.1]WFA04185.1 hypothetical protein P3X63_16345 [Bacillus sp. HSf4]